MPDIALRFGKDMLVVSAPAASAMKRRGVDDAKDAVLALLLEPETVEDALSLEAASGAQCLTAPTADLTPARLARLGLEERAEALAKSAITVTQGFKPQHVLVEVAPCGLPLDPWNKASLRENMDQYVRFARLFAAAKFDAFLLSGFTDSTDLKCALMGLRKVSDAPIMASVALSDDGTLADGASLEDAVRIMAEYQANVAGFETAAGPGTAIGLAERMRTCALEVQGAGEPMPVMATLLVAARDLKQNGPTGANPYYCADTMIEAAEELRRTGVQFLRAAGDATPAYTGVLVATTFGLDAVGGEGADVDSLPDAEDLEAFIAAARARVSAALEEAGLLDATIAAASAADAAALEAAEEPFDPSELDGPTPKAVKVSGLFPFGKPGEE